MRGFNRWNSGGTAGQVADIARGAAAPPSSPAPNAPNATPRTSPPSESSVRGGPGTTARTAAPASPGSAQVFDFPVAASTGRAAYVAGTFDTKGRELYFLRQCREWLGLRVVTVDLSTSGKPSTAAIQPREVARHHPDGEAAVFSGDRGSAVTAMALAFARFVE